MLKWIVSGNTLKLFRNWWKWYLQLPRCENGSKKELYLEEECTFYMCNEHKDEIKKIHLKSKICSFMWAFRIVWYNLGNIWINIVCSGWMSVHLCMQVGVYDHRLGTIKGPPLLFSALSSILWDRVCHQEWKLPDLMSLSA